MSSEEQSSTDPDRTVRDWTDVKGTSDVLRSYNADGRLYAYQDNEEHVIVSRGRNSRDRWVKRVPAVRNAEELNEKLWTIPSNWERKVGISGVGHNTIYFDPLADADVMVSDPVNDSLADAWYEITGIGELQFKFDGNLDFEALKEAINKCGESSHISTEVTYWLRSLADRWEVFKREYTESVELSGEEAMWHWIDQENTTLDSRSVNPWQDIVDAKYVVRDVLTEDRDTAENVAKMLREEDVISPYPQLKAVFVEEEDN